MNAKQMTPEEKEVQYRKVLKAAEHASTAGVYIELIEVLRELGDYKDAPALIRQYESVAGLMIEYHDVCMELDSAADQAALNRITKAHPKLKGYRDFDARVKAASEQITARKTEKTYLELCDKFSQAVTIDDYRALIHPFEVLKQYKDAPDYAKRCRKTAEQLEKDRVARVRAEALARNKAAAEAFDSYVRTLENGLRDQAWCTAVKSLPSRIHDNVRPHIQTGALVSQLVREAEQWEKDRATEQKRQNEAEVKEFTDSVRRLRDAPRGESFCTLVLEYDQAYKAKPADFRLAAIEADELLKSMMREVRHVRAAIPIDEHILLMKDRTPDLAWCRQILDLRESIAEPVYPYLREKDTLEKLCRAAREKQSTLLREQQAAEAKAIRNDQKQRRREKRQSALKNTVRGIWACILALVPFVGMMVWRNIDSTYWFLCAAVALGVSFLRLLTGGTWLRWLLSLGVDAILVWAVCRAQYTLVVVGVVSVVLFIRASRLTGRRHGGIISSCFEILIPMLCLTVALGLAFFPAWGMWAMVFIGGVSGACVWIYICVVWHMRDGEDAGWVGLVLSLILLAAGITFIFLSREFAYIACPLLLMTLIAGIIATTAMMGHDEENAVGIGGVTIPLALIFLVVSVIWCWKVWGFNPTTVDHEESTIVFHLDRTETDTFILDYERGIDTIKQVRAKNASAVAIEYGYSAVGEKAFKKCRKMKTVYISSSVTELSVNAFADCKALTTVYIGFNPDGTRDGYSSDLQTMEQFIFANSPVTTIYYNGTISEWQAIQKDEKQFLLPSKWHSYMEDFVVICNDGEIPYD